jgi:hypothetical protein
LLADAARPLFRGSRAHVRVQQSLRLAGLLVRSQLDELLRLEVEVEGLLVVLAREERLERGARVLAAEQDAH